jgi:hypothetical protein
MRSSADFRQSRRRSPSPPYATAAPVHGVVRGFLPTAAHFPPRPYVTVVPVHGVVRGFPRSPVRHRQGLSKPANLVFVSHRRGAVQPLAIAKNNEKNNASWGIVGGKAHPRLESALEDPRFTCLGGLPTQRSGAVAQIKPNLGRAQDRSTVPQFQFHE